MTDELHRSMRRSIYHPDGSGPRLKLIYHSGIPASEPEVTLSDGCHTILLRPEDIKTLRDWLFDASVEHKEYLNDCARAEAERVAAQTKNAGPLG